MELIIIVNYALPHNYLINNENASLGKLSMTLIYIILTLFITYNFDDFFLDIFNQISN